MKTHAVKWCQTHFALMADKGTWAVPRSGLIFQKRDKELVLIDRVLLFDDAEFQKYQDEDYELIREQFDAAGIKVVKSDEIQG